MPLQTSNYSYKSKRHYSGIISLLLVVGLACLLYLNYQNILDWWRLRGYIEPAIVSQLSSQDTMTAYANRIFKVNHPSLETKATFNKNCPNNGGEKTIVLGCYHSNQGGIFVQNIVDPRLNGVMQVTSAHEMLHAAYDRLSGNERTKVDAMLLDFYNHDLHDQRLLSTIASYKKTEPSSVVNEMHSVFGTEVANLPDPLEKYYSRYFTNRKQVAKFAAQYQSEFTSRENAIAEEDSNLNNLKAQIDTLESDLTTRLSNINSIQSQLLSLKNNGSIAAYNSEVPTYNQLVNSYNGEVDQVKTLVVNYNALVNTRNSTELTENQLYQELSNNPTTINK